MTRQEFFCQCFDVIEHWVNGNRKHLREVTDKLYNEVTKPHWISAKEDLPKIEEANCEWVGSEDVLALLWNGDMSVGRYERDNISGEYYWILYNVDKDHEVTHWMPLPALPKSSSSEIPNNCEKGGEDE